LLIQKCNKFTRSRAVLVVCFDIDDTLLDAGDEKMRAIKPTRDLYNDMVAYKKLPELVEHWLKQEKRRNPYPREAARDLKYVPDFRIMPVIVTARPYTPDNLVATMDDLKNAKVRVPQRRFPIWMRPALPHET
jgi:FMN phosphatase YigB (HAD superfamily)